MDRRRLLVASTATIALVGIAPLTQAAPSTLPLLARWTGPHNGAPPFDRIIVADFKPAMLVAMEENRAEIAAIVDDPAPASFVNTIGALENSGRALSRVSAMFNVWTSTLNDPAMRAVEQEIAPALAAFEDEVVQNAALFSRVKAVYDARAALDLTAEQQRLTWVVYRDFARRGAALTPDQKTQMAAINQRLATLSTTFSQNELADEEGYVLTLSEADLAGLPPSLVAGAAAAAKAKGLTGAWLITNTRSSMEPFLAYSSRRDLREKGFRVWTMRGDNGGAHDNNAIITEILALRAEKAKLLGFPTFAHWITDDPMAKTPDAAMDLDDEVCGRRPRRGRLRKWPTCRSSPTSRRRARGSNPGTTATIRRRCARRSTISMRTRSNPTCRWKNCARACSGPPASFTVSNSSR